MPAGKEGQKDRKDYVVRKREGHTTYAAPLMENGTGELTLWTEDPTGWIAEGPADYLTHPWAGTIHDAAGRVVARFDEGDVVAGTTRALYWDGPTESGTRGASGV